jgi:hypothetical protein
LSSREPSRIAGSALIAGVPKLALAHKALAAETMHGASLKRMPSRSPAKAGFQFCWMATRSCPIPGQSRNTWKTSSRIGLPCSVGGSAARHTLHQLLGRFGGQRGARSSFAHRCLRASSRKGPALFSRNPGEAFGMTLDQVSADRDTRVVGFRESLEPARSILTVRPPSPLRRLHSLRMLHVGKRHQKLSVADFESIR